MDLEVELELERMTAFRIAVVYVLAGAGWIVVTDALVAALAIDPALATRLQTAKGWAFVGVSGVLIYWLVARSLHEVTETNRTLETALQQTSVLQRVLRHNIRNVCNVIDLEVEWLAEQTDADRASEAAATIQRQTEDLVEMGAKAQDLRDVVLHHDVRRGPVDLVAVLEREIAALEEEHPDVVFRRELPASAAVGLDGQLGVAVEELLTNAVEHVETDPCIVWVTVTYERDAVVLEIADNGPGMPEMERDVLEAGVEKPLFHSQGLGLWLVRAIVTEAGGELHITDNEPRGTVIRLTLPTAGTGEGGLDGPLDEPP